MLKNKKMVIILLIAVVAGIIALLYLYPRSLVNFLKPLKNGQEIQYIRVMHEKGDETFIVEIKDKEIIVLLKEQIEKVRARYIRNKEMIKYSEENYLLTVHINSPDDSFIVQKDGTLYCNDKQYIPVDEETRILFEMLEKAALEQMGD